MSVNTKVNGQLVPSAGLYKKSTPMSVATCYSEDEHKIGVWINGKPLYQKTIDFGALPSSATQKDVPHNISNIEYVVDYDAVTYRNDGVTPDIFENVPNASTDTRYIFALGANETNVYIRTGTNQSSLSAYVTIRYTKTTDISGSGEYVPSGDKAVHYSENEEVIGTFLGSTLYRKVLTNSSSVLVSSSWSAFATAPSNIGSLIPTNPCLVRADGMVFYVNVRANSGNIEISYNNAGGTLTVTSGGYLIIEYTKASS